MGTECHVIVEGPRRLTGYAVDRIAELQRMWTRFDPSSPVMRVNRAGGGRLQPETWDLLVRGLVARRFTRGRFDPFMVRQVVAAGYDRDFADLDRQTMRPTTPAIPDPVLRLDRRSRTVVLAPGAELDTGGIGKGFAADLVAAELCRAGATACLVNVGGDLRVRGTRDAPWEIGIDNEVPGGPPLSVRLTGGALATSSRTRRVWHTDRGPAHHLIDPRTGRPVTGGAAAATAIAPTAWVAEALSKALMISSDRTGRRLVRRHRGAGLLQDRTGTVRQL